MRSRLARLALLIAGAACSSSAAGVAPTGALTLTPDNLPDAFAHAACDEIAPCCGASFHAAACTATWLGAAPKAEAAKTHAFDAAAARACVDAMRASRRKVIAAGCKSAPAETLIPFPEVNAACALVYTGTRVAGEPCSAALDCRAGMTCGRVGETGTAICREPRSAGAGEPCDEIGPTDTVTHACSASDGYFCSIDAHVCTAWLPENAPCDQIEACGPTRMCNDGACAPRVVPGASCCWPFACSSGFCRKDGVCAAPDAIPPDQVCDYLSNSHLDKRCLRAISAHVPVGSSSR